MREKKMPGVMVYFDMRSTVDSLNDEEAGRLLRAILSYGEDQAPVDFSDNRVLQVAWNGIQSKLDRDRVKYDRKVEAQRRNAHKRWDAMACQDMPTMPTITTTVTETETETTTATETEAITEGITETEGKDALAPFLSAKPWAEMTGEERWAYTRAKACAIRDIRLAQERMSG